jgi:hypothetical protein
MPSRAFSQWNIQAQLHILEWRARSDDCTYRMCICSAVNCRAIFYRDAERGDAVGYYQALADALEEAGIVKNDRLIVSWDGSRLSKDAANPRIEVVLEGVEP